MLLGITIALVGALGYALGAALQQHVAVADGATLRLVKRPRWWIGGAIGFAGATLHAVALSFAPLIVIQPVSVTTLVFAVPLAAMLYGRRPHRLEIIGSIAVAAGLLGLMMLVPAHDVPPVLSDREAVGFIATVALVVVVCYLLARRLTGAAKAMALAVPAGAVTASVSRRTVSGIRCRVAPVVRAAKSSRTLTSKPTPLHIEAVNPSCCGSWARQWVSRATTLRCSTCTPFGTPVEPEV